MNTSEVLTLHVVCARLGAALPLTMGFETEVIGGLASVQDNMTGGYQTVIGNTDSEVRAVIAGMWRNRNTYVVAMGGK